MGNAHTAVEIVRKFHPAGQEIQIPFQIEAVLARMSAATAVVYWTGLCVGVGMSMW